MGAMARDFYEASPYLLLPIVALALFGCAFLAITIRTFMIKRSVVDERALLALDDGERTTELSNV